MALPLLKGGIASSEVVEYMLASPALLGAVAAVLVALLVFLLQSSPKVASDAGESAGPKQEHLQQVLKAADLPVDLSKPNLMGAYIPAEGGLIQANSAEGYPFDNEFASGVFLPMHRPTYDKALDKSGNYPYSDHFKGRKRLWEMRLQMQFKKDVTEPMRFGIELEEYVPLNSATKRLMGVTVAALRSVAGSDLYHSVGDDPRKAGNKEAEKPVFSMPMWAFDQFIVTPTGETPPSLSDRYFSEFGFKRTDDRSRFIQEMTELRLLAGPTYTFSFWGISQFLDDINWRVQKVVPFKPIDFNMFCGKPPVHLVLYTLKHEGSEGRHVQSRKQYYFRLAFWSSLKPPATERLQELILSDGSGGPPLAGVAEKKRNGWSGRLTGLVGCCGAQREQR